MVKVEDLLKRNEFNPDNPMDGPTSLAFKNHILRVAKALTLQGRDTIPLQASLAARNSGPVGTGKLINPLFPFGAPPGAVGVATAFADVGPNSPGLPYFDELNDFHKQQAIINAKKFSDLNLYTEKSNTNNSYYEETQTINQNGVEIQVPDFSKLFTENNSGFDFGNGQKGYKSFKPKIENRKRKDDRQNKMEKAISNEDTFFGPKDLERGYLDEEDFEKEGIFEGTNYLPFYMEDLRNPVGLKTRIYFRAFFKGLRETISPSWTQENYYGRVDPVGTYVGTSRTVSLSFAVVAMSPQGFTAMWKKMNQLAKLFLPTFRNGVMIKSPTCRLRIGDLICDESGNGLPGYFSSPLELDYTDSTWEIEQWTGPSATEELGKAPQMIICSTTFQVIHETNPQLDETNAFDTTFFRRIGKLKEIDENGPSDIEEGGLEVVGD